MQHFIILSKTTKFDGRRGTYETYYKVWNNAEKALNEQVNELVENDAKIVREWDRMNVEKGFYEYQKDLEMVDKYGDFLEYTFSLLDGYFED